MDVIKELGGDETTAAADVEAVIQLEMKLANVSAPDADRGIVSRIYNPYKLNDYQGELDKLPIANPWAKVSLILSACQSGGIVPADFTSKCARFVRSRSTFLHCYRKSLRIRE